MTNFRSRSKQIGKNPYKPLLLVVAMLMSITGMAQSRRLITGKSIVWPPLGTQQNVGNLPVNIILSPNGKYAISTDAGFNETLWSINAQTGALLSHIDYPNNFSPFTNGLYYGLVFGNNSTLYAAQGGNDTIAVVTVADDGELFQTGSIATRAGDFPSGLAVDSRGYLYVANNDPATFSVASSVAIYSRTMGAEVGRYSFTSSYHGTPNFPLAIATLSNGSKTYVTSERDGAVYDLNTTNPTNPTLRGSIRTGANPNALLLHQALSLLYVANGGSDTVSVVDTATDSIVQTVSVRPAQMRNQAGTSTPTGLSLSPDGSTLYVALGDLNAVAVLDVEGPGLALKGFIPAGWYPSGVAATKDHLLVANAKGTTPRYPNSGYVQWDFGSSPFYDLNLIEGNVSFIADPDPQHLAQATKMVLENNGISDSAQSSGGESFGLPPGSIKHVIYIVKENRTYDQVLGDVPGGDGDPSLTLFGRSVTPNLHALAERFLLMDNYYVDSEVSFDGWAWSTEAIANEDLIRNVPYNYSGRGRNYDSEGQNNGYLVGGFPATFDGMQLSYYYPKGAPPIPDVTEGPGRHIWDAVEAAKLSYRNYGFFLSFGVSDSMGRVIMPDNYPDVAGNQPPGHDLAGRSDIDYHRFDLTYADSDAPTKYGWPRSTSVYGKYKSPSRYSEWVREFKEMLAQDPTGSTVPSFMTVRFGDDHTQGPTSGDPTPSAEVADNDYAVGQLVEAISHSPIWKSTAIFIVEDDSQDGPDHVDCHRSTGYVISPWIKHNAIDHEFHNTTAMLKTIPRQRAGSEAERADLEVC